ncbi:MAG: hypothetical protein KAG28_02805 [Cocleimonas sp.]|nr:hypothetical protein [Cocleimonas sp.]
MATSNPFSLFSALSNIFKISTLFLLVLGVIFSVRISDLHNQFIHQDPLKVEKRTPHNKTETQRLFEDLMRAKQLITVESDARLRLPAKDYALSHKVAGQALSDEEESLLDRLYYSIAGKAVQHQIKFWNHSRLLAAVRDNLHHPDNKTDSLWQVKNHWGDRPLASDWVPLSYGYINGSRLTTGFNDWLSVADQQPLTFSSRITLARARTISIQVVGQPDLSRLKGRAVLFACSPPTKKQRQRGSETRCKKTSGTNAHVSAYVIRLSLPAGRHQLNLSVKPVRNTEKRIDGLPIYLTEDNQYAWEPVREYKRNPVVSDHRKYRFKLLTKDGRSLTNPIDSSPTRFSHDNGLVTLVGYEKTDRYALSGLLSASTLPHDQTEVRLTLNSQLQQLAQKHLEKQLPLMGKNATYARQRRAAVVLLNPNTGAILAAANMPKPPAGIHRWDRISYSRLYPNRDPFGVNAWQGLDNHNAPGSTFKTVTALSAMQAADEGRDDLEKMIKGLSSREFKALTGLPVTAASYQPDLETTSVISNAGKAPLLRSMPYRMQDNKMYYPPLRTSAKGDGCSTGGLKSKNLGLREATRDSLNVWYARLGVMMDGNNLSTGGKDTSLAKMARLLGFQSISSLASDTLPLKRIAGGRGRGDVLNAFAGSLALADERLIEKEQKMLAENRIRRTTALQRLTQNSFGQGVATTPLQMARVAASVATGKIPQPYLIHQWDTDIIEPSPPRTLKLTLIDYLRQGMKAVPEVGTARSAFQRFYKRGKCRTYGKTGTAQVGRGGKRASYNSAWFVGWHEDSQGKPDLSFACMVTHAYAMGKRTGGSVCAPIIARILSDLDRAKTAKPQEQK